MGQLADFIHTERDKIMAEWESFARSLLPAGSALTALALRDHGDQILTAIVHDMTSSQSTEEQAEKSKGRGAAQHLEELGQIHAALRLEDGFRLVQVVAEYRALRASVLRLWENAGTDPTGVTRFNEAVDEALVEAVERFTKTSEHFRDQTLGILGHDLRNPLAAIITGSTMLAEAEGQDARTTRIAARMLNSAQRMSRMIADLLDLTRTRLGDQLPVHPVAADLESICRQMIAELQGLHPRGGLHFHTKGDLRGHWDSDRIGQVVSNFIRNAIQHGSPGTPIELRAEDQGEAVLLTVHNMGKPISPLAQRSMFEPMVRHVEAGHRHPGLGLGLYIALQIVLAHQGTLTVASSEADGTTFTVRLPRLPSPHRKPSNQSAEALSSESASERLL